MVRSERKMEKTGVGMKGEAEGGQAGRGDEEGRRRRRVDAAGGLTFRL